MHGETLKLIRLVFITEVESVYSAVRTEYIKQIRFVRKSLRHTRSLGGPVRYAVPTPTVRLILFPLASYFERHLLETLE